MGNLQCPLLQRAVVVDFSIDCQQGAARGISEGLRSTCDVDNGQSLVGEDGVVGLHHAGPVRPSVMLT